MSGPLFLRVMSIKLCRSFRKFHALKYFFLWRLNLPSGLIQKNDVPCSVDVATEEDSHRKASNNNELDMKNGNKHRWLGKVNWYISCSSQWEDSYGLYLVLDQDLGGKPNLCSR
ncbi:hypothetical protein Y1Q_0001346 [Alligator mississippiensis]|uniref:Uncharacterized protein n=1 Tax=Alligator mississippiensis TaxID=8496 RepID=A0A151M978_ALLMI|nr:hypothetical protein Y1Q_0001346 [Alligator mississippiensis]